MYSSVQYEIVDAHDEHVGGTLGHAAAVETHVLTGDAVRVAVLLVAAELALRVARAPAQELIERLDPEARRARHRAVLLHLVHPARRLRLLRRRRAI